MSLHLLGRDSGAAEIAGRPVSLRLRHSEILALLCAEPGGLSSDQLSTELYGDAARAGGVRVEISRLRKLLGDCIEPERYRLSPAVSSDLARIWGLLHRGEVREAATRYRGPLLPRSRAPGVVRRREALEHWLRQSVMTAGDEDALWAWLQTASGARDGPAWRRLLSSLAFHDPRRSLAASRIAELRAQRGTLRPSTSL
ncbi:MAG: helix-turn-helix domain-containing protein [Solirubrobacterales bacterium]|nr:helix-turn-helix domain-containing protein [Solirubrobacterales bacterium]